ncbi:MAG TPA: ABC transporter ATP-binding protein [Candidatus Binatia bacterium]|nr:ABC transporter ATP-binding protein [Candidatus Binatia bacterium]
MASELSIRHLEAGYGNLQVLFGVSLDVPPGEIAVLIGPNGAGKSTVLKSVFKLTDIFKGSIFYQNKDITKLPTHERIKLGISIVPQGRQVFPSLTVKENLEMGAYLLKERILVRKRLEDVLHHFPELRPKLHDNAYTLSGGQQQMLAMGRALMQKPKLLLLDEPSLGLAPQVMRDLFKRIQSINKEGTAVLMVEQNAKAACAIADTIYVLEEGKVALQGGKALLKDARIKHIYLGGHGH